MYRKAGKKNRMIVYDLQCEAGHRFEGWFDDGDAYEAQRKSNLIACPVCSDVNVSKLPSTFAIKGGSSQSRNTEAQVDLDMIKRSVSDYLANNFDDVGCGFATEALKIHYGVSDRKNIRGTSTKEEEKLLEKEGVPFFKVPPPSSSDSEV